MVRTTTRSLCLGVAFVLSLVVTLGCGDSKSPKRGSGASKRSSSEAAKSALAKKTESEAVKVTETSKITESSEDSRKVETISKPKPDPKPAPARQVTGLIESDPERGLELVKPPHAGVASRGPATSKISFINVAQAAGITHVHQKGDFDEKLANIMPWISSIGSAVAVSDYDGDGDLDFYATSSKIGTPNFLYRNEGGLEFTEVAKDAGVADVNDLTGVSMDVVFCDLDNDGDDDLYVVKWGTNQLFRNDGNGKFTDITESSGTGDKGNANAIVPFDYDNDGKLDLFVCNYFPNVDLTNLDSTRIMHDSFEAARNGGANTLYRNLGGLRFDEVAHGLQLDDTGWSLDAGISDIDNDGDVDLYIANDFGQDKLFLNNGDGTFTDFTMTAIGPETFKGMNVDFGDFNNDGFSDIYVTNITTKEYLKEGNFLFLNGGDQTFTNVSGTTRTFDGGWGWCGRFFDYDLDGDLDIVTVNGFVSDGEEAYWEALANVAVDPTFEPEDSTQWPPMKNFSLSGHESTRLFRNKGDGAFEEVAVAEGVGQTFDGRGIALADLDDDGDLEIYFANQGAPAVLSRNYASEMGARQQKHWLKVSLVGTKSNRNAIGARVQVTAKDVSTGSKIHLTREVTGVNGYASQSSYRLHFGLAKAMVVEKMTVFWPSGVVQEFDRLRADRHYRVTEKGEPASAEERQSKYFAVVREREVVAEAASPTRVLELEGQLRRKPRNMSLANQYRFECVEGGYFDRSIEFFRDLVRVTDGQPAVRLQLALALIDKIPTLSNEAIRQASIAKESLAELGLVGERYPDSYAVHYISGMNHLYWPHTLKHWDDAIVHFEKCLELQEEHTKLGRPVEQHYSEIFLGLGDAQVKGKNPAAARDVWKRGQAAFPNDQRYAERLAVPDTRLLETVKNDRGLAQRIDTRLAMLLDENGLAEKEEQLAKTPSERHILNAYRLEAFELEVLDRAEQFLAKLADEHPDDREIALHRALIFADRLNETGLPSEDDKALYAMVRELSQSLDAGLEDFGKAKSGDSSDGEWLGPLLRGLYPLYLGGAAKGVAADSKTLSHLDAALAASRDAAGALRVPFPAIALGDTHVLSGNVAKAREIWAEAAKTFFRDKALAKRRQCADGTLASLLKSEYDIHRGMPTDLEQLADREADLRDLEKRLRAELSVDLAGRYRRKVIEGPDAERGVRFFRELVEASPSDGDLRVQLALALIDRTPDRALGSVRKGLLSSEALEAIAPVIDANPGSWGLYYLRGMIHLNWFTKLKHVPFALEAFEKCLDLQKENEGEKTFYALPYRAIGDAYVKNGEFSKGRQRYWRVGLKKFPNDRGLTERVDLTAYMAGPYVEERRSWAFRQDTWKIATLIGSVAKIPAETARRGE